MKKHVALLLILLLLAGCKQASVDASPASSSQPSTPANLSSEEPDQSPEPDEASRSLEASRTPVATEHSIIIYTYRPAEQNYFPHTVPIGELTTAAVIDLVTDQLDLPPLPAEVERQKGTITLDVGGGYIDEYLTDEETEQILWNSLCMSLLESGLGVENLVLRRDGGNYRSVNLTLADMPWEYAPLQIGGGTAAEYTELRASLPYEGMQNTAESIRYDILPTDDTGKELMLYLYRLGDPGADVASPFGLDPDFVLGRALSNVIWYMTYDYGTVDTYRPELRPITAAVEDDTVALGEHVQAVVRELFGDIPFEHRDFSAWKWHPVEGVYTPPHMGGGLPAQPILYEYEDLGDTYRIEMAYLRDAMGAFMDDEDNILSEAELREAVQTKLRRREVILRKIEDGVIFESHCYL